MMTTYQALLMKSLHIYLDIPRVSLCASESQTVSVVEGLMMSSQIVPFVRLSPTHHD